ncbi:MAG: IPT/TIG domain-containing protein [Bacteriovoracaceae bacterium]|nr:IPT/TIG domain-containing protein [Bacteriovoracaceae bacterium]
MKSINLLLLFTIFFATSCVVGEVQAPKDSSGAVVAPSLNSLSPSFGPLAGGTTVTLSGSAFATGLSVDIGGVTCASVSVLSTTSATCITASNSAGSKTVSLTRTDGLSTSLSSVFTYIGAPTITSISPTVGYTNIGTPVTITGTNFVSGATVTIGGITCGSASVLSSTSISCTAGPRTAAAVTATVTNTDSQSGTGGSFFYVDPPNPTGLSTAAMGAGALAGGTAIVITGSNFLSPTVSIGPYPCTVGSSTATTINCTTTGTAVAGTYDIVVTNSNNLSGTFSNGYKYQAAPTVTSISPTGGSNSTSTTVTISGTGFDTIRGVSINLTGCGTVIPASQTSATCTTTGGALGAANVIVTNLDGDNQANIAPFTTFTYRVAPTIGSVVADTGTSPAGSINGGTHLTINGTDFVNPSVSIGGSTCTVNTGLSSSTVIDCTTTARSAGTANVVVTNEDNQTDTASNAFTYQVAPTIDTNGVSPNGGNPSTNTIVTITGQNFDTVNGVVVEIDGFVCGTQAGLTATSVTCTTTGGSGIVNVEVINQDGDLQTALLTNGFTYQAAPTISSVSPNAGAQTGTPIITINGSNFLAGATVTVGGTTCGNPSVDTINDIITCERPPRAAGPAVDVVVTNPDNQTGTASSAYTYQVPPDLVSLSVSAGRTIGNFNTTLTGTDFVGAVVTINGRTCLEVSQNATTIVCSIPSNLGVAGTYDVVVTNSDGQVDTLPSGFRYIGPPTISSRNPTGGNPIGNSTTLFINGSFDMGVGVQQVYIGLLPCDSFSATSTIIQCDPPDQGVGAYAIRVVMNDGGNQEVTATDTYTYSPAPVVGSVSPIGGSTLGNTLVTITGTGFLPNADILIGPSATCNLVSVSGDGTQITCTTSATIANTYDVTVTNTDDQTDTLSASYTYAIPPTVSDLSGNHDNASATGGSTIRIEGTSFVTGAVAYLDGQVCTSTTFVSAGAVDCVVPARLGTATAGAKDVRVVNPDGQEATGVGIFTYTDPPVITSISRGIGSTLGSETITINGTNFGTTGGLSDVSLAGVTCGTFTLVSSTEITCITAPTGSAVTGDVVVVNADSDLLSDTITNGFSYIAPPNIVSINVANGPSNGGTTLILTGSGFIVGGPTTVTIAGATCTGPVVGGTIVSGVGDQLTCTTGLATAGLNYPIVITNFDGQTDPDGTPTFTYDPPPRFNATTPLTITTGSTAGGGSLTVNGGDFVSPLDISIGGSPFTSCSFTNATSATCPIPAGTIGAQDVIIRNPDLQTATLTGGYTYVSAPAVTSASPNIVDAVASTLIRVLGSGFINGTGLAVNIDPSGTNDVCTSPTWVNSGEITCTAPPHASGLVDIQVTNGDGSNQLSTGGTSVLNFIAAPTITPASISPSSGVETGGTTITITGTNFTTTPVPEVFVNGVACQSLANITTTSIDCVTPNILPTTGAVDVMVRIYGTVSATEVGGYTYNPKPRVDAVSPTEGPKTGGTILTIDGANFVNNVATTISVGGIPCDTAVSITTTQITCTLSTVSGNGPTGSAQTIVVTNNDGQVGTSTALYTYLEAPVITNISPSAGKASGEIITITGTDFRTSVSVDINGSSCSIIGTPTATSIQCTTPILTGTSSYNVVVTNTDGQADTEVNGFQAQAEPTIAGALSPNSGDLSGGTLVTITGTNFEAGALVSFGASSGITPDSISGTTITVRSPLSVSTGLVNVVVQNPTGQSVTSTNAFTYTPAAPELEFQIGTLSPNPPNPADYDAAPNSSSAVNRSLTYTLKNVGSATTSTITISRSGANTAAYFINSDTCTGTTLAANAECTVDVIFLGAIMAASTTYTATLNATDGTTTSTNNMTGSTP